MMKECMTPRERVLAAIARRPVDRLPMNYIANAEVTERLLTHFGARDEEELLEALHIDMRRVGHWSMWPPPEPDAEGYVTNVYGLRVRGNGNSLSKAEVIYPFNEDTTVDDVHAHPWPDPADADYSGIREECARHAGRYATYGSPWCPFFHEAGWLLGQETFLIWMHTKPDAVDAVIGHIVEYQLEVTRRFLDECARRLDIAYFGNDYGTQQSLFISPALWERFMRRPQKRFFDLARDYGCAVMHHSCGAIRPLIPMLMEDGVDILDPVQTAAAGMAFPGLARDFGGRLAFHGGIDTQGVLPFGEPADVRAQVRAHMGAVAGRGGYILMGSQNLIGDIPTENILAMYDEPLRG